MNGTKTSNGIEYLSKVLLTLGKNPKDVWTVDDAVKGVSIMGGTGSGKTTASGKNLALQFLKEGWGGLVLCAKTDEARLWEEYCKETGRENDLIIFGNGAKHTSGKYEGERIVFNPIDYEMKRPGEGAGDTQNITNIFMNIYHMGNRITHTGETREERYWDMALKRCLNRVIELIKTAGEDLSFSNMVKVIVSSSKVDADKFTKGMVDYESDEKRADIEDEVNFCLKCLLKIYFKYFFDDPDSEEKKEVPPEIDHVFELIDDYFTQVLPTMGDKTKSVVTESFMGLAEPFLSGLLYKHFSGATNIFPELTYQEQKIIVLDFPIKEYLDMGIIGQSVFKLLFQQAVERRDVNKYPVPVFLWCDEAQYFVNSYDQIFLTTARSSRTATIFLSQNLTNYLAMMGSGGDSKARVDSLMGNLCTKIFHANTDAVTNEYASRLIGQAEFQHTTVGMNHAAFSIAETYTQNQATRYLPQVQPREFTTLLTGGITNDFKVHGIVIVSGRKWANEKNFLTVSFTQKFND